MNARDLETRLRGGYRREADQADPGALSERVHSIPATVEPERRSPWHGFGFGALRSAGPGGTQVRGASNMLTAIRIAAVVAALTLGSTLLAVQVSGPDDEAFQAPSATTGEAWATVTGTQRLRGTIEGALVGQNLGMSDPRLEGKVRITYESGMPSDDDSGLDSTLWSVVTITNENGSWHGPSIGFVHERGVHHHIAWFEGAGDYEGLVFLEQLTEESASAGMDLDIAGLVYEGELPPMVLPAPTSD